MITNLCLLIFACLEIQWHIGRIMVHDLVFREGASVPTSPLSLLVYATVAAGETIRQLHRGSGKNAALIAAQPGHNSTGL